MKKITSIFLIVTVVFSLMYVNADAEVYHYEKELEFVQMLNLFPNTDFDELETERPVLREFYTTAMSNIWGDSFSPYIGKSGMISAREATQQMLELLGYKEMVTYRGWKNVAMNLRLLKNVNVNSEREMTYGEFAALLYNARKVPLYEIASISQEKMKFDSSKDTFLSGILKCREVEGILTDNGCTALDNESRIGRNHIKIDDELFQNPEALHYVTEWIGRKVWGYVTGEEGDIQTIVALKTEEYDTFVKFDIGDFKSLSGRTLSYFADDKSRSISLDRTPYIIYNGKFERTLKSEFFDYEYGNVVVGSTDGTNYNIVIIEGYVSWYISNIDTDNMKIYPSSTDRSLQNGKRVLNVDATDKKVRLFDKYGDETNFNSFYKNTVIDICENGDYIKIMIADKNVFDACITSIDSKYYYTDEAGYRISKKYAEHKDAVLPEVGGYYNLYLSNFGFLVKAEKISSDHERVGLFMKAEKIEGKLKDAGRMKIFTENGSMEIYDVNDKIKFTDSNNNSEKYSYNQVYNLLENYGENILSYKLNAEGKITEIALPIECGTERRQGQLGYILENERAYYEATKLNLEGKAIVNDSLTKVFITNLSVTDEGKRYSVEAISSLGTSSGPWNAFNTEPDSPYVEYVKLDVENKTSELSGFTWFIVTNTYIGMNDDGDAKNYFDGYVIGGEKYAAAKKYYCEDDILSDVTDVAKSGKRYAVTEGDIVLVKATLDEINELYVLYKSDLEKEGRNGMIAGNLGYFDPANLAISNPFIMGKSSNALGEGAYTTPWRTIFGYVQHMDSRGNMTITTQDLTAGDYDASNSDPRYVTEYVAPSAFMTELKIDRNRNITTVKTISSNEVKPYDIVGNNCSRIIVYTWYGKYSRMIIINEDE